MKQAIVAIEDRRFFEHRGVDLRGIAARRLAGRPQQGGRPGRLDDHAAVRQERVRRRASGRSSRKLKEAALAWQLEQALVEGPDPDRLPEHDLLRERRLRHRAGRARLLPARRVELTLAEAALLAGHPGRPEPLRPGREPEGGARAAARRCSSAMLDQERHHRRRSSGAPNRTPLPKPEDVRLPGTRGPGAVLRRLRQAAARRPSTARARSSAAGSRSTTSIDLELQKLGARGDREVADRRRTGPPRRSSRSTRATAACSRWSAATNYREEPVQPRRPGRAPAGLVVQAVRARRGARAGDLARRRRSTSKPVTISLGDKLWYVRNYEGVVPRRRST